MAEDPCVRQDVDVARRLGILGGTFDPPHYGHLVIAETARVQLDLDRVLFVPAAQPPHKSGQRISSAHHRAAMVAVAIADNPAFELSRVDLDRPGPNYTARMLELVREKAPGAELFFLIGGDSLSEMHSWYDPAGIVAQARLAVMRRRDHEVDLERMERAVPGIGGRVHWLDAPLLDVSSTDLRRRVRAGLPIRYLVPPAVEDYVREHQLHRG